VNKVAQTKIKYSTAYPTSVVVGGLDRFGYEIAKSLTQQGGFVIIIDNLDKQLDFAGFAELNNVAFIDYLGIGDLIDSVRRLDYIFYLNHQSPLSQSELSSQDFLAASSYLNQLLNLAAEFEALFLLTNSIKYHRLSSIENVNPGLYQSQRWFSAVEFVRYSENLALEYKQAKGIEVKILRLGEIIGEAIELDKNTNIGKLVLQGISGEDLYLEEDGLNSEYYVHLLDAVYGVIKAQFTKGTEDIIYNVAYKEPYTELSLAYKLQELEPQAGNIKFLEDENPSVRLGQPKYLPAPNLERIGWRPKVEFEQALLQTIAFSKSLIKSKSAASYDEDEPVSLGSAEAVSYGPQGMKNGALSRLIEERKLNASSQRQKFNQSLASSELKKRKTSFGAKLRKGVVRRIDKIKKQLDFLQNVTLTEMGIYLLLVSIFMLVFFTILSPVVIISRDILLARANTVALNESRQSSNWEDVLGRSALLKNNLKSLEETLTGADILVSLTGQQQLRQEMLGFAQSYQFLADSISSYGSAMKALEDYQNEVRTEIVPRLTNSSVLSLGDSQQGTSGETQDTSVDQQDPGQLFATAQSNLDLAQRSFRNYQRLSEKLNPQIMPQFIQTLFGDINSSLNTLPDSLSQANFVISYLKLSSSDSHNQAIIITDELRPNSSAGEVVGVGLVSYSKGRITGVSLAPVQNIAFAATSLTDGENLEVTRLSGLQIDRVNPNVAEVSRYLLSDSNRDGFWGRVLTSTYNKSIDSIWYINSGSLTSLLAKYPDLQINNQVLTSTGYLQTISGLQAESLNSRNTLITNTFALVLEKLLGKDNSTPVGRFGIVKSEIDNGRMKLDNATSTKIGLDKSAPEVKIGIISVDPGRYVLRPVVAAGITNEIATNNSVFSTVTADFSGSSGARQAFICVDRTASDLSPAGLGIELYRVANLEQYNCVIILTSQVEKLGISYRKNMQASEYTQSIALASGVTLRYDVETKFSPGVDLGGIESLPQARVSGAGLFYTGETQGKFKFSVKVKEKNE